MKKIYAVCLIVILCLSLTTACESKKTTHMGMNVKILEICNEMNVMVVEVLNESLLGDKGDKCIISCDNESLYYLYVDNDTSEIKDLNFSDFIVGDEITVDVTVDENISRVSNSFAVADRIQLLTQKL